MDITHYIFIMSLCSCVIIPVVLLLRLVLKKAPKWINVLLWGIVALSLIVSPIIDSFVPNSPGNQDNPSIEREICEDPIDPSDPNPSVDLPPESPDSPAIPSIETSDDANTPEGVLNRIKSIVKNIPESINNFYNNHIACHYKPLLIIWGVGAGSMLLYTAVSYWCLRRKVATAVRLIENIYQSKHVGFPFVLGLFKPRIYLPFKISLQDLEYIIAHEQAHIRRKDHWWKPLGFLLLTMHWFNPLMWLAYILLCRDIELACDEKVIRDLGNEQKADYILALVTCSVKRHTVTACPLAFGAVGVKDRVKAVMNYKKPTLWVKLVSIIVCIAVTMLSLTFAIYAAFAISKTDEPTTEIEETTPETKEPTQSIPTDPEYHTVPGGGLLFVPATGTIIGYVGSPTKIEIPAEIAGVTVVAIGPGAFRYCGSLTSVTIANGVETIDAFAFAHCPNLANIDLPDSVKTIGRLAFRLCESLRSIDLPEGLESIGNKAFAYSGLIEITIPASITSFGNSVFSGCNKLTGIHFGGSQAQWEQLVHGSHSRNYNGAVIHYNAA